MEPDSGHARQRIRMPQWWDTRKALRSIVTLLLVALALFLLITCIRFILPFLIAGIIILVLEPVVGFLNKKLRIPRAFASLISLLLFAVIVISILSWLSVTLVGELLNMARNLPSVASVIATFDHFIEMGRDYFETIPPDVLNVLEGALEQNVQRLAITLNTALTQMVGFSLSAVGGFIARLPIFILVSFITMVAAFFMSRDRAKISKFFELQMPEGGREAYRKLKGGMFSAIVGVLRAQITIGIINGSIAFLGYTIAGVPFPLLIAFFTALLDVLPVVGAGTILMPWYIITFLMGNYRMGAILLVTHTCTIIVRQLLEPRLMGRGLGLHPLVTMMAMYIGLRAGGVVGLFVAPLLVVFIKTLQEADLLPKFRQEPPVPIIEEEKSEDKTEEEGKDI